MKLKELAGKATRSLQRDSGLPATQLLAKGLRYVAATASAPMYLRECTRVGDRPRTVGRPLVDNRGRIEVGDDLNVNCTFAPVQFHSGPSGELVIGDRVDINFGTALSAQQSVRIGSRVRIGPWCIVADAGTVDARTEGGATPVSAEPIVIGDDVWLAGRVTVQPGARIGAGSVITAGSVVKGEIPSGVVAGGIPARVVRRLDGGDATEAERRATPAVPVPTPPPVAQTPAPVADAAPDRVVQFRGRLVSDFTIDELSRQMAADASVPVIESEVGSFGQVVPELMMIADGALPASDFLWVWTRPEAAAPSFAKLLTHEAVDVAELLAEVDEFCSRVIAAATRARFTFVPTFILPAWNRGMGLLDARAGQGLAHALTAMNLRLMEKLGGTGNVFVLDAQRWVASVGRSATHPKLWYLGKVPFHADVFKEALKDLKSALSGLTGGARKLVVVDLDDTLWGGIVGDAGWQNLRLGGHDGQGEAFVEFQRQLKALTRRGIVLAIASKNDEAVALEAIESHPAMVLRKSDFVGWRINWRDKAQNIAELALELNLGLQSVVFLDDNPVERARVKEALPEVLVPEWPEDKLLYTQALLQLRCFDAPAVSREDQERTKMYVSEREREQLKRNVGSVDDWLKSLDIRVRVEPLNDVNLQRTTQLFNKTNQMNLSTRRVTDQELRAWADSAQRAVWTFTVGDRFGDAGLTGIVSVEQDGENARVVDYILSCRVFGRKIEETMLAIAVEWAQARGVKRLTAEYLPTAKNKPTLEFLQRSGLQSEGSTFSWNAAEPYPVPEVIRLEKDALGAR